MNSVQSQLNEEQMVRQALSGRTEAYELLLKKYWKLAVAAALSKCHDPATAEDIAQESFMHAFRYLRTLQNQNRFTGWLMTIVHQKYIEHLRLQVQRQKIELLEPVRQNFMAAANPGLSTEQVTFVHNAIANLPQKFQTVILMRFVGGLSTEQIAEQLNKRHNTVRVWLHRAYNTLRKNLAPIIQEVQL